jgi:hypothetical protein
MATCQHGFSISASTRSQRFHENCTALQYLTVRQGSVSTPLGRMSQHYVTPESDQMHTMVQDPQLVQFYMNSYSVLRMGMGIM